MEKFISLPVEKQKTIIDAALKAFSTNGYKKTSASDIAAAAGISKAMVFHYFGTKKAMYLYLFDLCGSIIMNEVKDKFDSTITDFFERIKLSTEIKLAAIKKHPAVIAFITSAYFEDDEEVKDDIKAILVKGEGFRNTLALDGVDYSKFKEDVDLKIVMKMLSWLAEGYTTQISRSSGPVDFDALCSEFYECMDMLKKNFYKDEYL